jgi:hypothetical protein
LLLKDSRLTWNEKIELLKTKPGNSRLWAKALRSAGKAKNKQKNIFNLYWQTIFNYLLNKPYEIPDGYIDSESLIKMERAPYDLFCMCRDNCFIEEYKKIIYEKHYAYFQHLDKDQYIKAFINVMNEEDMKVTISYFNKFYTRENTFKTLEGICKNLDKTSPFYNKFHDDILNLYDKIVSIKVMEKLTTTN